MRRFFLPGQLSASMSITGQDAGHIAKVLRMKPGDEVILVDTVGSSCTARLTKVTAQETTAEYIGALSETREPFVEIYLVQGLPKNEKMDFIVQKAVELGAAGIIPVEMKNSVVHYDLDRQVKKQVRWQKIASEAAKQCQRQLVPPVMPVMSLSAAAAWAREQEARLIMLYEGNADCALRQVLRGPAAKRYAVFVGPEGGFTPEEVAVLRQSGTAVATIGPRILRTETAAVAAMAVLMYELGDLGGWQCQRQHS